MSDALAPVNAAAAYDRAVPLLAAAQQTLAAAQSRYNNDNATLHSLQGEDNTLLKEMEQSGINEGRLSRLHMLQAQIQQQNNTISSDQQQVYNAQAQVDTYEQLVSSTHVDADEQNAGTAYNTLMQQLKNNGISLKNGATLTTTQQGQLSQSAQAAYDKYTQAIAQTQVDNATANKANAELQLYASDTAKYGAAAADAATAANNALKPLGLTYTGPKAIDLNKAQQNFNTALQISNFANADLTYYNAVVNVDGAEANLKTDQNLAATDRQYIKLTELQIADDQQAVAEAEGNLQNAQTSLQNVVVQAVQQLGLQGELGADVSQQHLNDAQKNLAAAEANLAAAEKSNYRTVETPEAEEQVEEAQQNLQQAQKQFAARKAGITTISRNSPLPNSQRGNFRTLLRK